MADVITNITNQTELDAWLLALPAVNDGNRHVGNITASGDYTLGEVSTKAVDYLIKADDAVRYDFDNPTRPHAAIISSAQCFYPRSPVPRVCEIEGFRSETTSSTLDNIQSGTFEDSNVIVRRCRLIGGKNGCGNARAGATVHVENCVITDAEEFGIRGASVGVTATHTVVANCNTSGNAFRSGIQTTAGAAFDSCIAFNNSNKDWFDTAGNANNCASGDLTAFGSDAVTGIVAGDFTNTASNIWTSANGGALDGTGSGGSDIGLQLVAINNIVITSPAEWYLQQRNVATNTADITITGTYSGSVTPTAIEASFNGGAFQTIDASPTGGNYSGTLTGQSVGNGDLIVRFVNDTSISSIRANIAVGIKILFWGQSNFSGRANNAQSYTGTNGFFHKYTVTNDAWQEGNDPFDTATASGSLFPLLANLLVQEKNIPVGFIGVAQGSTTLSQWQSGQTLNARMLDYLTNSGGNDVEVIASWIGESDASASTSETDFKNQYNAVINQLETLTGTKSVLCGIAQEIGNANNVRQWIQDIVSTNANAIGYVDMYAVFQAVHYETDQETQGVAQALFQNLLDNVFNSTLTVTVVGTGNNSYDMKFMNITDGNEGHITNRNVTFTNNVMTEVLPVDVGTVVLADLPDSNPPTTGTGVRGVTV